MANRLQELLTEAFKKLIDSIYKGGSIDPRFYKVDDLGLDSTEIDFVKVLGSKEAKAVIEEFATKVSELGFDESKADKIVNDFVKAVADTVKITNVDLSTEPMYETKFKQMFASMILQKAQSMNPSRDSSADDAHKGGEKKTMKVEQIGVGNLNVFLDNTGADFTIDQIVNLLAAQLMSTEINIDTVINILTNQELKVKIMVGDKELDIKDARKVLIDAVQVVVKSRVDILQEIVAKITSNIKVDVTQDLIDVMLKDVEKIRVALGVDIKVFKDLLNERFASLNIDYRFTGVTKIKAAISEMVDTTEAVKVVLDKLGITDGTISVKKNVTAELIAAIKEVSVQCGVTVTELVQALKQKTKVKLVDEKGIEITEDTLLDIVSEVTVDVQDTATVEVVDKLTAMFAEFKTLKLSTEEIVSRIASLSFIAQVDVDKVVDMLLAREDTRIDIEYVDSEGKTVNLREVLKSKIKAGLVTKAENGVISDITSILKDASFDGKLDGKSLEKIVKELDTVRAKYKVSVEDLVSLIVEYKSEIGVDFTLDGKVVDASVLGIELGKALNKQAVTTAKDAVQDVLSKFKTEREVDIIDLVQLLQPIEMNYGVDIDTLVDFIAADTTINLNFYYKNEKGEKVVVNSSELGELDRAILGKLEKVIQTKTDNGLISILTPIIAQIPTNGKITDFSAVLKQIADVSIQMDIDVDKLVEVIKDKFTVKLDETKLEELKVKIHQHINQSAIDLLAKEINDSIVGEGDTRTLKSEDVLKHIKEVSIKYGINPEELLQQLVDSGKLAVTLDQANIDVLKKGIAKHLDNKALDTLLGELGVDKDGNIVLADGTLDPEVVARKILSISQAFALSPEDIIAKLEAKFNAKVDPNKLNVLKDKIKGKAMAKGYSELLALLGVDAQGIINLGNADLKPEVIARKIKSISVTFGVNANELIEMLKKEDKLKGVIDFDKDDFFKKVSDAVAGKAIDDFANDVNNATKGGVKGTLTPDQLKDLAKKLNPIVVKYNLSEDDLNQLIAYLDEMGKISGQIDPSNMDKLVEVLGKTDLKGKISFTDLTSIIKVAGLTQIDQSTMFNLLLNIYANGGSYNPGSGVCRPASPNVVIVNGGGTQYVPVGMMPGMVGGFGGGFIGGGFGGGMIAPPYMPLPPYWPGFTCPAGGNEEIKKALQSLTDSLDKLSKRVADLEKGGSSTGGTGGGTPTPPTPPTKEYTPTEAELLDIVTNVLGIPEADFAKVDDTTLDSLVDPVTKELEARHKDYTIKGVKRSLVTLRSKLAKTHTTPPKDDKHMVTKEDIRDFLVSEGVKITNKNDLKKVPAFVKSNIAKLQAMFPGKKLEGVDQAIADFMAAYSALLDANKQQDIADVELPDTSKPIEGKKSRWRRFWSWANRHKVMLLGIGLTVGASAVGLGFAANALNGLIMTNIANGAAAATSGILMEGGFVHGLVSKVAETGFATWINTHVPIAAAAAGLGGLGGVVATTLGAVNITKGRKLAASYNGVLKSRRKFRAADGSTRALIKQKLHLTEMLHALQQERSELRYSSKQRSRITKEIKQVKKEMEKVDKKLGKSEKKETGTLIKEIRKVTKLNKREAKYGRKVAGGKGVGTKGYAQKYIDLVQKFRAGQIDEDTFREKVEAIPVQYRTQKYDTFTTEVKEDIADFRNNTQASADTTNIPRTGKTVDEIEEEYGLDK